jgi:ABC-2 type transport system permease protein
MNLIGAWTLYQKEVLRFIKVYNQALVAPVITSLLYLAIFVLAVGDHLHTINQVPFIHFMASGVIIMSSVQNAFANSSTPLIMGKLMGNIIDYITPPLTPNGVIWACTLGGVTRGVVVGILVWLALLPFVRLGVYDAKLLIFYLIASSMMLAQIGVLVGLVASTYEQMSVINSYFITPFSFLSGTFYSIKNLPPFFYKLCHFNPFFYMIDGFRYGMLGCHDGRLDIGVVVLIGSIIALHCVNYAIFTSGYGIKS